MYFPYRKEPILKCRISSARNHALINLQICLCINNVSIYLDDERYCSCEVYLHGYLCSTLSYIEAYYNIVKKYASS